MSWMFPKVQFGIDNLIKYLQNTWKNNYMNNSIDRMILCEEHYLITTYEYAECF